MILLVALNSKFCHTNIAVRYLKNSLDKRGYFSSILELTVNEDKDTILHQILKHGVKYVCFSTYIWNVEKITSLSKSIKNIRPEVTIILGGPEACVDSYYLLKNYDSIDYIIKDSGEESIVKLFDCNREWNELSGVEGLCFIKHGDYYENKSLKKESFEKSIKVEDYVKEVDMKDQIAYYESTRGCPHSCSYCISSIDKNLASKPLDEVFSDIIQFINAKATLVKFIDRSFNFNSDRASKIIDFIIKNNRETKFHFEILGERIDDRLINTLQKAPWGMFQFEIGIQSTNQKTLASVNRSQCVKDCISKIEILISLNNCHTHIDLIAGLPFEGYQRFMKSISDVIKLKPNALQLGFLKILKGTKIQSELEKYDYKYDLSPPYTFYSNLFMTYDERSKLVDFEKVFDVIYNKAGYRELLTLLDKEGRLELFIDIVVSELNRMGQLHLPIGYTKISDLICLVVGKFDSDLKSYYIAFLDDRLIRNIHSDLYSLAEEFPKEMIYSFWNSIPPEIYFGKTISHKQAFKNSRIVSLDGTNVKLYVKVSNNYASKINKIDITREWGVINGWPEKGLLLL